MKAHRARKRIKARRARTGRKTLGKQGYGVTQARRALGCVKCVGHEGTRASKLAHLPST